MVAKTAKKKNAKKGKKVAKAAKSGEAKVARPRTSYDDGSKIKVIGEHSRREGSRYHTGYENLRKAATVGAFRKKHPDDANELLRNAAKDGYIEIA
jgi:hypothetical protein